MKVTKAPRKMPKAGYYKWRGQGNDPNNINVIYTTGIRGGGGHMYYRVAGGDVWGWCPLLWTCVPGVDKLTQYYDYYPDLPPNIPPRPRKE